MEDYIFLIIAIVLSVLSAVNQNKKKKKAAQEAIDQPKVQPRNPLFDQRFGGGFFDEQDEEKVVPVHIQRVKPEVKVVQPTRESFVRHEYKTTLPPTIKRKEKPQPVKRDLLEEDSTEDNDEVSYLSDFSLRKACVYSEILNRKY